MLIESKRIRHLLNTTPETLISLHSIHYNNPEDLAEPKSYRFSMNPLPALVVLLLGLMMSSHHQSSMVSTMIHKQVSNHSILLSSSNSKAGAFHVVSFTDMVEVGNSSRWSCVRSRCVLHCFLPCSAHVDLARSTANGIDHSILFDGWRCGIHG